MFLKYITNVVCCALKGEVSINYNKLHADPKQGKTLDIGMERSILFSLR